MILEHEIDQHVIDECAGNFVSVDKDVQLTSSVFLDLEPYFLIQRSKNMPERFCQALNNPNKSAAGNILFAWGDTKDARKNESQLIVILNDQNNMPKGIQEAFMNYEAKVILWSERNKESNIALLSA